MNREEFIQVLVESIDVLAETKTVRHLDDGSYFIRASSTMTIQAKKSKVNVNTIMEAAEFDDPGYRVYDTLVRAHTRQTANLFDKIANRLKGAVRDVKSKT